MFFQLRSTMASHSELTKKQAQDAYGRFASSSSQQVQYRTTPPPSQDVRCTVAPPSHRQEVGSSSYRTASPPSRMQQVGSTSRRTTPPLRILEVHSLRVNELDALCICMNMMDTGYICLC
jgi:hypothetical protein